MAVVRNTKSGKSVMFVDERGFCYITSRKYLSQFINGFSSVPLRLTLLPTRVEGNRFKGSDVFTGRGVMSLDEAFEEGFVDKSFYDSVVEVDFLAEKKNKEDVVKGKTVKAVDFDL